MKMLLLAVILSDMELCICISAVQQGRFRLYQLAYRLTEGDNLLGALRGIHVDGVVDLIVLFLSHGNGYCVKRIVFPQGRRL